MKLAGETITPNLFYIIVGLLLLVLILLISLICTCCGCSCCCCTGEGNKVGIDETAAYETDKDRGADSADVELVSNKQPVGTPIQAMKLEDVSH